MIEVLDPGPLCTLQDRGRIGFGHLGVARSGAADRAAYALANRLAGNHVGAAALEITMGGLLLFMRRASLLVVTGAPCRTTVVTGTVRSSDLGDQIATAVPAGATVTFCAPIAGIRTYLAVRGGIEVPAVLGSRSTDLLGGLGPPPLRTGDLLPIGADPHTPVPTVVAPRAPVDDATLRLWPGPRLSWFNDASAGRLVASAYVVQRDSNRIAARLSGPPMTRRVTRELPPEGLVEGAVQVPTDGQPLIFLADHPATGGYPVIAVVHESDIWKVAQARPGDALRFTWAVARSAEPSDHTDGGFPLG